MKKKLTKHEALMWSIALPGFGQLLNGRFLKGLTFIILEFLINVKSNFNLGILYSFIWEINNAFDVINYQWLMFYPCLYMFAMWDAYRDAAEEIHPYDYLPFVFGAYFVTVGLMYSSRFPIMGTLIGPIFLPILSLIPGLTIGYLIKLVLKYIRKQKET